MESTIKCKCGSPKVRMVNPSPLSENAYEGKPYLFDSEAYATAKCDDCGLETKVIGTINWEKRI